MDKKDTIIFCILVVVLLALGSASGFTLARRLEQNKAIEAGVGRWVIDENTAAVSFEYGGKP